MHTTIEISLDVLLALNFYTHAVKHTQNHALKQSPIPMRAVFSETPAESSGKLWGLFWRS